VPITEVHRDAFRPRFKAGTPTLQVTPEQQLAIREILDICCSDSRFAEKAYIALTQFILSQVPEPVAPTLTSLTPATLPVASPPFTLTITGTGFEPTSQLLWNGTPYPAVSVDATQLTASIDVSLQAEPFSYPVKVLNSGGLESNELTFELTAVAPLSSANPLPPDFVVKGAYKDEKDNKFDPKVDLNVPSKREPVVPSLDEVKEKDIVQNLKDSKKEEKR
jgi:hypothetical protein